MLDIKQVQVLANHLCELVDQWASDRALQGTLPKDWAHMKYQSLWYLGTQALGEEAPASALNLQVRLRVYRSLDNEFLADVQEDGTGVYNLLAQTAGACAFHPQEGTPLQLIWERTWRAELPSPQAVASHLPPWPTRVHRRAQTLMLEALPRQNQEAISDWLRRAQQLCVEMTWPHTTANHTHSHLCDRLRRALPQNLENRLLETAGRLLSHPLETSLDELP